MITIAEKAKAYDEALERSRELLSKCVTSMDRRTKVYRVEDIESIFPELKKSEDEQSKKWVLEYLYDGLRKSDEQFKGQFKAAIAWLEKQGEQKPVISDDALREGIAHFGITQYQIDKWLKKYIDIKKQGETIDNTDKVKRFHEGDWIANGGANPCYVKSIFGDYYELCSCEGFEYTKPIIDVDYNYHRWTLNDAKDGDILITVDNGHPFIYKVGNFKRPELYAAYCAIDSDGSFYRGNNDNIPWSHSKTQPATKEQRETLFKAIQNAGYIFDFEKKELKIKDWSKHIKYKPNSPSITEENTDWSEEDEKMVNDIIAAIDTLHYHGMVNWLRSIKYRVLPQSLQNLNEEDSMQLQRIIDFLLHDKKGDTDAISLQEQDIDWLKSFKQRINERK